MAGGTRSFSAMRTFFGHSGPLEAVLPLRAAERTGGARRGGRGARSRATRISWPRRARHRQEPRLPRPGASPGEAHRRLHRYQGAAGAAAREGRAGRRGGVGVSFGAASSRAGRTISAGRASHGLELLAGVGPALFRTADDAQEFERMRDWAAATESGDRAELSFEPSGSLWRSSRSAAIAVSAVAARSPACFRSARARRPGRPSRHREPRPLPGGRRHPLRTDGAGILPSTMP